jgi:hypothetical protein
MATGPYVSWSGPEHQLPHRWTHQPCVYSVICRESALLGRVRSASSPTEFSHKLGIMRSPERPLEVVKKPVGARLRFGPSYCSGAAGPLPEGRSGGEMWIKVRRSLKGTVLACTIKAIAQVTGTGRPASGISA